MLNNFERIIKNFNILLAYSGGIDSTFLLHQLLKFKKSNPNFKFRAIHINHQIHKDSGKWSKQCQNTCKLYNIPFIVKNIKITTIKNGIEATARAIRYKKIYNELKPKEIIATGHNLNDQCETFLLALKRGSGITGLCSMSYDIKINNKEKIVRPLLNISRLKILQWMTKEKLSWIEDSSNYDINNDRNFIRHKIIPQFNQRWKYFDKNCAKSIKILNEEKNTLEKFIQKSIKGYLISDSIINFSKIKSMTNSLRNIILRYWIKLNYGLTPKYKLILEIYYKMIKSKIDSMPKIKVDKYQIQRYNSYLYWNKNIPDIKNMILIWNDIQKKIKMPYELGFITKNKFGTKLPFPKNSESVNIRFDTSQKFLINKNSKRKTLKQIFKEYKIAPWYRNKIPLIFYNNKFICALGLFVTYQKFKKSNKNLYLSWINFLK